MYTYVSEILSTVDAHGPGPGPGCGQATPAVTGCGHCGRGRHRRRIEALQHANRPLIALVQVHRSPHRLAQCADDSFCYRARRAGGVEPACTNAPNGACPRGERKDALDTVALRRCRAQVVASIAAAAATASLGVKPKAEAPHSAPVAPRNARRRRLRRRTCTARARAPRHRAAGTSWPEFESPSAAPP